MGNKYDAAFKLECIRMVEEDGLNGMEVSRKLGIHEKTIYRWIAEHRKNGDAAFPGKGNQTPDYAEIRRLNKRIRDLEEENEILKKAAVIFVKHQK
jgi:transposase